MKTRPSTDIVAWIIAVIAAILIREGTSDLAIQLPSTILGCGIAGFFWIALRATACRIVRRNDTRWLSAMFAVVSAVGAGILALLMVVMFDIPTARSVIAIALLLAGFGWGVSSEFIFARRRVQIA